MKNFVFSGAVAGSITAKRNCIKQNLCHNIYYLLYKKKTCGEKMKYIADENRYSGTMKYLRCGKSGLLLPRVSLGLWHNFGTYDSFENMKKMICKAFDLGITHFDLANNYGPLPGSAEENFGRIINTELKAYRDEIIVSTKAGYDMWPGPYGDFGSRKYLTASLNQSLKRPSMGFSRQEYWSGVPLPSPNRRHRYYQITLQLVQLSQTTIYMPHFKTIRSINT